MLDDDNTEMCDWIIALLFILFLAACAADII